MKFDEAFDLLIAGKPIRHQSWTDETHWQIVNGKLVENRNYYPNTVNVDWWSVENAKKYWPNDWEVYLPTVRFKDLKPGQKFRYKNANGTDEVKLRLEDRRGEKHLYAILRTGYVVPCACPDIDEVIIID